MYLLSDESLSRFRLQQYAGFSVLNQTLVQEDGQLTARGWGAVSGLVSSAICILLYKGTRPLTWALIPGYRKLITEDRRNWDSRYSSNVHAVLCVYFAWYCLVRSDFFWRDDPTPMILRTNAQTYIALGISFGYFAVDFVSCVKYNMGGLEMFLHHLGSLLSVATALVTGDCHMHTLWMLVTEFTTPLINNRWWLDKLEMKATQVYIFNGLAILICWMFARLSVFPPFFYIAWKTRDQIALITPLSQVLALIVPIILTTLNLYWFTRIVKGAYKALFGSPKVKQA